MARANTGAMAVLEVDAEVGVEFDEDDPQAASPRAPTTVTTAQTAPSFLICPSHPPFQSHPMAAQHRENVTNRCHGSGECQRPPGGEASLTSTAHSYA